MMIHALLRPLLSLIALWLRKAKTCLTARRTREDGSVVYVRSRRWRALWLVPAGNLLLRHAKVRVGFLPNAEWRAWELAVYQALGVANVTADDRGRLILPSFPGSPLDKLLESNVDTDLKRRAAIESLRKLRRAHQCRLTWPDGIERTFSHGDATVRNVIFEQVTRRAWWIDFESLHDSTLTDAARRADDIRAWLVSAVECWPEVDALAQAVVEGYRDADVVAVLAEQLRCGRENLYHLAQGRISPQQRARFVELLSEKR
jgi:hypothetical protein